MSLLDAQFFSHSITKVERNLWKMQRNRPNIEMYRGGKKGKEKGIRKNIERGQKKSCKKEENESEKKSTKKRREMAKKARTSLKLFISVSNQTDFFGFYNKRTF